MRGISREVLARAAAARLVGGACRGTAQLWTEQEQVHAEALTPRDAQEAARPLVAMCTDCRVEEDCAVWAQIDQYTGIAAGVAWVKGRPRPVHTIRGRVEEAS